MVRRRPGGRADGRAQRRQFTANAEDKGNIDAIIGMEVG
jgi:hypothetical protein